MNSEPCLTSSSLSPGKSILTPLHKFLGAKKKDREALSFTNHPIILETLCDIQILLCGSTSQLTHVCKLVPDLPAYNTRPVAFGSVEASTSTLLSNWGLPGIAS